MDNKCEICGVAYEMLAHLSGHIKRTHGLTFKEYYDTHLKTEGEGFCKTCNGDTTFHKGVYSLFCSSTCSNNDPQVKESISRSVKNSLGKRSPQEKALTNRKRVETTREKYGVDNISQLDDHRKERSINCRLRDDDVRCKLKKLSWGPIIEARKETNLKKYGFTSPAKNEIIRNKIRATKYATFYKKLLSIGHIAVPLFNIDEFDGTKSKKYPWKCSICSNDFQCYISDGRLPRCTKCYPKVRSKIEADVVSWLKGRDITVVQNDRTTIAPLELDIVLPEFKIAIEIDGLYWHSEVSGQKNKDYHLNKLEQCQKMGFKLIHIFEDELMLKSDIVFSRLNNFISNNTKRIYARKCDIRLIDAKVKKEFLNSNHIQGNDKGSVCLGAFYEDHLVSVMSFSKGRKCLNVRNQEGQWELSRFCSELNTNVIGIASKLLKHFERGYKPLRITTYADRRWSEGELYEKIGFSFTHFSKPSYFYYRYGYIERLHRFNFRKGVLPKKLKLFDANLTEWENMQINGYDRIWDCGTYVYEKVY